MFVLCKEHLAVNSSLCQVIMLSCKGESFLPPHTQTQPAQPVHLLFHPHQGVCLSNCPHSAVCVPLASGSLQLYIEISMFFLVVIPCLTLLFLFMPTISVFWECLGCLHACTLNATCLSEGQTWPSAFILPSSEMGW